MFYLLLRGALKKLDSGYYWTQRLIDYISYLKGCFWNLICISSNICGSQDMDFLSLKVIHQNKYIFQLENALKLVAYSREKLFVQMRPDLPKFFNLLYIVDLIRGVYRSG